MPSRALIAVEVSNSSFDINTALHLLPDAIRHQLLQRKVRLEIDLASQLLRYYGCSRLLGIQWENLEFTASRLGKPALLGESTLSFNISKGNSSVVMYILQDEELQNVGVDVASTSVVSDWSNDYLDLFSNIFSSEEYTCLRETNYRTQRDVLFTRYWSLKEAYAKYTGNGLNSELNSISFGRLKGFGRKEHHVFCIVLNNELLRFHSFWLDDDSIVSTCEGPLIEIDDTIRIDIERISMTSLIDTLITSKESSKPDR
ncbi:HCL078Wp [Eremothecium sinecaudum]|uniref:holo-[acyl-carrier-protein] synthase n=1 Tax=Eremothecium sinecaudum TaxID=45286 RepID=A0A109UZC4_9SACH|nr:HCL078Wp [Eremothecium sinecaudum]AMD20073.1 HCL078Wp [Eremothecium sinecaudum]